MGGRWWEGGRPGDGGVVVEPYCTHSVERSTFLIAGDIIY